MDKVKIGIIGCGNISPIYLKNLTTVFKNTEVKYVADRIHERAIKRSEEYGPKAVSVAELLADDEIEIVLNITNPDQHTIVNRQILAAGKSAHSEKPFNGFLEDAKELMIEAEQKGLRIGGAPDTFLGAGIQTCRKLIDEGAIGEVVGATAFMTCHGHESWHPDPEFYYKHGGGPMLDMGPYYVTALVNLLGGVKRLGGMVATPFKERTCTCKEHNGEIITVDVPTSYYGTMEFESGTVASILMSFDIWGAKLPIIEIYGSKGTLRVPDPNCFGGPVILHTPDKGDEEIPLCFDYPENSRALGLAEMASALQAGRRPRASYQQTLHVLEVLTGFERAVKEGGYLELTTKYEREAPMAQGLPHGVLD